jgi:hypothetical protein
MNAFDAAFNPSLDAAEAVMGEPFSIGEVQCFAVSIEGLDYTRTVMLGGQFIDASTSMVVRKSQITGASIGKGSILTVRGQQVRVISTVDDGDDCMTLLCGPAGIKLK